MELVPGESAVILRPVGGAVPLELIWIEAGSFLMGSPDDEQGRSGSREDQFQATLSSGYWISRSCLTQAQWRSLTGIGETLPLEKADLPVGDLSWFDAEQICSEFTAGCGVELPRGFEFQLPSEAQWEYACRAGTVTRYPTGNLDSDVDRIAWHRGNSGGVPQPVGRRESNAWKLHDMLGNVWEWCSDWLDEYPSRLATDWIGPESGSLKIMRGGSVRSDPKDGTLRCAYRGYMDPAVGMPLFSLRLCVSTLAVRRQ